MSHPVQQYCAGSHCSPTSSSPYTLAEHSGPPSAALPTSPAPLHALSHLRHQAKWTPCISPKWPVTFHPWASVFLAPSASPAIEYNQLWSLLRDQLLRMKDSHQGAQLVNTKSVIYKGTSGHSWAPCLPLLAVAERLESKDTKRNGSQLPLQQTSWLPGFAALGLQSSSHWLYPQPVGPAGYSLCPGWRGNNSMSKTGV